MNGCRYAALVRSSIRAHGITYRIAVVMRPVYLAVGAWTTWNAIGAAWSSDWTNWAAMTVATVMNCASYCMANRTRRRASDSLAVDRIELAEHLRECEFESEGP